jgi:tetratricopeptide (TPR) repeat protein
MKALFPTIAFLLFIVFRVSAQDAVDEKMYQSYLQHDKEQWKRAVELRTQDSKKFPADANKQFNLAFTRFSLLNSAMAKKDEDLFDDYIDETKGLLKKLVDNKKVAAESKALLSAVYGLQIGFSPMKGISLGNTSSRLADEAKTLAPNSAIAWRMYGSNNYYTPSTFGGDIKKAIAALEQAIKLFESKSELTKNNWLYLDTMALLGQAYLKNEEKTKAIVVYQKAISIEPAFEYAKQLLSKAKSN